MKTTCQLILLFVGIHYCVEAQHNNIQLPTSINENGFDPDSSAILDLQSASKGVLIPRMSTAQRNAISSLAQGLLVFDTDAGGFWYYYGAIWTNLSSYAIIKDEDGDTRIDVEQTADDDIIRFGTSGTEYFRMHKGRLEAKNTGQSVFIGTGAGAKDDRSNNHNIGIGQRALFSNIDGHYKTAIGYRTLYYDTSGWQNTATGYKALYSNTNGFENTANGAFALSNNKTGFRNVAMGDSALFSNIAGWTNTANDNRSLRSNTNGFENTANGSRALYYNTDGWQNTATGHEALYSNTTGSSNTGVGNQALYTNSTGGGNTAAGDWALYSNSTGDNNVAVGFWSLRANTTGRNNNAIGYWALNSNTTGSYNNAIGDRALNSNNTGWYNSALGRYANSICDTCYNSTGLGYNADCTADDQVRIGNSNVVSIGGFQDWTNVSDLRFKKNITQEMHGMDFILRLRPVTYKLDQAAVEKFFRTKFPYADIPEKTSKHFAEKMYRSGFIAQEVEEAARQLGFKFSGVDPPKNEGDFYGLRYATFVVPLVKGMQEQQEIIENLQSENRTYEARIKELENRLDVIDAMLVGLK